MTKGDLLCQDKQECYFVKILKVELEETRDRYQCLVDGDSTGPATATGEITHYVLSRRMKRLLEREISLSGINLFPLLDKFPVDDYEDDRGIRLFRA